MGDDGFEDNAKGALGPVQISGQQFPPHGPPAATFHFHRAHVPEARKEAGMIVVCGEALVDMVPSKCGAEGGYVPRPGGSPSNVAVGLAGLDVPVAFLGKASSDPFGRLLRRHLETNAVDLRYV